MTTTLYATSYKLTPAEEDKVMAGHAPLRALAQETCFASNTGLAWRVANDMLRLPEPTMRQHFDDSDTKPYGELRRRDNCPRAPASLIAFVTQGTRDSDTPDPPVWLHVAGLRDNRDGPEQQEYQLDYEICPASERCNRFDRNVRRIALRLASFCLQEDGLGLPS